MSYERKIKFIQPDSNLYDRRGRLMHLFVEMQKNAENTLQFIDSMNHKRKHCQKKNYHSSKTSNNVSFQKLKENLVSSRQLAKDKEQIKSNIKALDAYKGGKPYRYQKGTQSDFPQNKQLRYQLKFNGKNVRIEQYESRIASKPQIYLSRKINKVQKQLQRIKQQQNNLKGLRLSEQLRKWKL